MMTQQALRMPRCRRRVASIFALCSYALYIIITKVLFFLSRVATTPLFRPTRVAIICLSVAVFLSEICFHLAHHQYRFACLVEYKVYLLRRDCPLGADITNQMRVRGESCVLIAAADGSAARSYTYPVCLRNERGADVRAGKSKSILCTLLERRIDRVTIVVVCRNVRGSTSSGHQSERCGACAFESRRQR